MWLAIVNADVENIKKYGNELGAGDLAPLLACILASRSWQSLTEGLTNVKKKRDSKAEVRARANATCTNRIFTTLCFSASNCGSTRRSISRK